MFILCAIKLLVFAIPCIPSRVLLKKQVLKEYIKFVSILNDQKKQNVTNYLRNIYIYSKLIFKKQRYNQLEKERIEGNDLRVRREKH